MDKLGDFISQPIKEKLVDSSIKIGSVIRCYTNHTHPPKEKRFVVLGKDKHNNIIGAIFINSNINFKVLNSQELWDLQYPVQKKSNSYLHHDSFVDCSKMVKLDYNALLNETIKKPNCILGSVNPTDLEEIIKLVKSSNNISPIELKNIGLIE